MDRGTRALIASARPLLGPRASRLVPSPLAIARALPWPIGAVFTGAEPARAIFQVFESLNPDGSNGFYMPATDWNGAEQTFQGSLSYPTPTGITSYLMAQDAPASMVAYGKRLPNDDNRQIAFGYRIGAGVPMGQITSVSQLNRLVWDVKNAAGWGGKFLIWATDTRDGSWVYYFDNQRQP